MGRKEREGGWGERMTKNDRREGRREEQKGEFLVPLNLAEPVFGSTNL